MVPLTNILLLLPPFDNPGKAPEQVRGIKTLSEAEPIVASTQRQRQPAAGGNGAGAFPDEEGDKEDDETASLQLCAESVKENLHEELYTQA